MPDGTGELGFDPAALHRKYLAERDKRLRPEAVGQYISVVGRFREFADDPYAEPGYTRAPHAGEVDVLVLGGGFAGVQTAVRLRQAGVNDFLLIEKGGDFGGTWYWNRYPGLRCDIESYIYLPFLEETGYIPAEKYARGSEIFAHFRRIAEKFGLYPNALFRTQLTSIRWDPEDSRWIVRTSRGDDIRARFVCLGGAGLHRPKLPGITGIEGFRGRAFHTSRWDYGYTGGDESGNLAGLADKRVAVIGTGATAIQVVPNVARYARQLYVVQRTPSTVDARNNRPTDPGWAAALPAGWQKRRRDNFSALLSGVPQDEDLVADSWTDVARKMTLFSASAVSSAEAAQLADYQKMEQLRARVDEIVTDPGTAERLKPWYNYVCKRPCFSDEYLQAFNQPNVTLIDTDGRGLDRVTEHGIESGGQEYEVDCIIFATGFDSFLPVYETGEFEVVGRHGVSLADRWRGDVKSVHGILVNGFPNMFIIGSKPHAASTVNAPHMMDEQAIHIAALIKRCLVSQARELEVRPDAEGRWAAVIDAKRLDRVKFFEECTPGYYNYEGAKDRSSLLADAYGAGPVSYIEVLAQWREDGFAADVEPAKGTSGAGPLPRGLRQRTHRPFRRVDADHRGLRDRGVRHDLVLDFGRRYPLASRFHEILGPVDEPDVSLAARPGDIAGLQPAAGGPPGPAVTISLPETASPPAGTGAGSSTGSPASVPASRPRKSSW
jgi:cyclohexanone monooxygenase